MSDDRPASQPTRSWLDRIIGAFSGDNEEPSSRDELISFLKEASTRLSLDQDGVTIIEGAFDISTMQAREAMVPRSQIVAIQADHSPDQCLPIIRETAHSRYPVIDDNLDEVVGVLLVKDMLPLILQDSEERQRFRLREVLRPALFIPESKRLNNLLREFRDTRNHMAVVVDEYGGTAGIITIEDILEQIVGDIEDEHDIDEEDDIRDLGNGTYAVKALTPIDDFNDRFESSFSDEEFDTVGGLVMQRFGHLPARNESTEIDHWRFTVMNADSRRIRWLQAARIDAGNVVDDTSHSDH